MRRRLTVTGASQNIDGVVKPGVAESGELKKFVGKKKDKVRSRWQSRSCGLYYCPSFSYH
jgi:hypothetical protein